MTRTTPPPGCRIPGWGVLLFIALLTLAGCASGPQTRQLLQATPSQLPQHLELTEVPFHPQELYQCGPAALATVLNWSGEQVRPAVLVDEVYLPGRQGSLQLEMLAGSRRHGRIPYRIAPKLETLLAEVSAGNPVLVLQNLGLSWVPQWHYAVVVGYDLAQPAIILRSGLESRLLTDMNTFELTWARSNYWGIVVLPPDTLPATAEATRYLQAVVPLENIQRWDLAQTAYRTALGRWPDNLLALMGLGNSAYRLGELDAAREAFQAAVQHHPASGAAHNNLAQVLLEQGRLEEAHGHAKQAVELGGAQRASFQATLRDIEQRLAPAATSPAD